MRYVVILMLLAIAQPPKTDYTYDDWLRHLTRLRVTVAKDTTYVTGPLRADGTVDFVAAANAIFADVKPEDNAMVPLLHAFGPSIGPQRLSEYCRLLGCPPPSPNGDYLINPMMEWRDTELHDELERCLKEPWSAAKHPKFAELLRKCEPGLKLATEASKRQRFYDPRVPLPTQSLAFLDRPSDHLRTPVRLFVLRAMNRLHDGRIPDALEDLESCYGLARAVAVGPKSLREGLMASAIAGFALNSERVIPLRGMGDASLYKERLRRLTSMNLPRATHGVCQLERLEVIEGSVRAMTDGWDEGVFGKNNPGGPAQRFFFSYLCDADEVLRNLNRFFDDLEEIEKVADSTQHRRRGAQYHQEFRSRIGAYKRNIGRRWLREVWEHGLRKGNGRFMGDGFLAMWGPALTSAFEGYHRIHEMNIRQTVLAYALCAYKLDRGRYPEALDAKSLGVPPEFVVDPFTDATFAYRIEKGKRQVVCAFLDGVVGPKVKPDDPDATASERELGSKADDFILELP